MTDETNDAWMKPEPASPWSALRWRFLGCLLLLPVLLLGGRLLPETLLPETLALALLKLPVALWLLALALFARARFWRDPRPLWGRFALGDDAAGLALRLAATGATMILGLVAFVLALFFVALPFNAGRW